MRFVGPGSPGEGFTLRSLLRSLNSELSLGYRREVAMMTANLKRQITNQGVLLETLQADAREEEREVGPEALEQLELLKSELEEVTFVHDNTAAVSKEFQDVRFAFWRCPSLSPCLPCHLFCHCPCDLPAADGLSFSSSSSSHPR